MAATRNKRSPEPVARLRQTLKTKLGEWLGEGALTGRQVAVGFSGGRDSLALLHALVSLRDGTGVIPSALHVHHGLSPHADLWVARLENLCKSMDVPLSVVRVRVPEQSGLGLEGAARAERYRVFSNCGAEMLLLGHHQDDQAETLLFNLVRGAGVHGAAAMPPLRQLARAHSNGALFLPLGRPWLDVSRAEIDAYIDASGLSAIDDESNEDRRFSRNHLRHEVLPRLVDRFPQARGSMASAARRFGEAATLLDALADLDLANVLAGTNLDLAKLLTLDNLRQRNLLRRWLSQAGVALSSESALSEFLRQCQTASAQSLVAMPFGPFSLRRWQGKIYCVPEVPRVLSPAQDWCGEAEVSWCGGKVRMTPSTGNGIRAAMLGGRVEIRLRQGSEVLRLKVGGPRRPLRLLLQERGIPPWERPRLPLLWIGGVLAAVGGVGIAAEFRASESEKSVDFVWLPG